jgi:hypothetical protein
VRVAVTTTAGSTEGALVWIGASVFAGGVLVPVSARTAHVAAANRMAAVGIAARLLFNFESHNMMRRNYLRISALSKQKEVLHSRSKLWGRTNEYFTCGLRDRSVSHRFGFPALGQDSISGASYFLSKQGLFSDIPGLHCRGGRV